MRRIVIGLVLASGLVASPALATRPTVRTLPRLREPPLARQIARHFPERAKQDGVSGWAVVVCRISERGKVSACVARTQAPQGYGFGEAALALITELRFVPGTIDGSPIEGEITVPIDFSGPPGPHPKP